MTEAERVELAIHRRALNQLAVLRRAGTFNHELQSEWERRVRREAELLAVAVRAEAAAL